jgi:uncharacterized membrane protein
MAFCTACGAQVDQAAFCQKCGARQNVAAPPAGSGSVPAAGMAENKAGALCYVLGWITGIIFLLVDKRPFVRFHAAQSIVVFGGLHILHIIAGIFVGVSFLSGGFHMFGPGVVLMHLIHLTTLIMWVLLMVKAYQGERFKVPIAYELAEGIVGK